MKIDKIIKKIVQFRFLSQRRENEDANLICLLVSDKMTLLFNRQGTKGIHTGR